MTTPKLIGISGSLRRNSLNTKLLRAAGVQAGRLGAEFDLLDLQQLEIPMYDGDLEDAQGLPRGVLALRDKMLACDGMLIACPEYNGSISGALKNAIDWATRPREGEPPLACFKGKTAGLLAASPGRLGGVRGLGHVRTILSGIGMLVVPGDCGLPGADAVLGDDGTITDEAAAKGVGNLVGGLVDVTRAIKASR